MAKTKISEYDAISANNTDVDSINIAEGCAPSGINNAIREVMAHLKDFQTGASGDSLTVGGNLSVTGTVTIPDNAISGDKVEGGTINAITINTLTAGQANFGDNAKAIFGDGSDLQIYHDGSHSYIQDAGTGHLRLLGNNLQILNGDNTANYIICSNGGAVDLYHNNAKKFATTSTGIDVTGLTDTDTLNVSGNVTLGDASTDIVTVNGYMGVGGAGSAGNGVYVVSTALTTSTQTGVWSSPIGTSSAISSVNGFMAQPQTAAASFISDSVYGFRALNAIKGAGSTITNQHGLFIADQTQGTNNYGITSAVSSGTNKWNIYSSGTAANYFAGSVGIGTSLPVFTSGYTGIHLNASYPEIHLTNPNSGTTATDGFKIQQNSGNNIYLWNYENAFLALGTNNTECARITSAGELLVGATSGSNSCRFVVRNTALTRTWGFGTSGANTGFYVLDNTTGVGVYVVAGATSWTGISDERYKTDLKPIENAAQKVSTLRAVTGRFKTDSEGASRSFLIAQDVQAVLPEAVDATNPDKLGLSYTDTIPLLVAAIKEQQAIIESLKARLDAANL